MTAKKTIRFQPVDVAKLNGLNELAEKKTEAKKKHVSKYTEKKSSILYILWLRRGVFNLLDDFPILNRVWIFS